MGSSLSKAPARSSSSAPAGIAVLSGAYISLDLLERVMEGTSTPFVKAVAEVALEVIEIAKRIRSNREQCADLTERATSLLVVILGSLAGKPEDAIPNHSRIGIERLTNNFHEVLAELRIIDKRSRNRRAVLYYLNNEEKLKGCSEKLHWAMEEFQVTSMVSSCLNDLQEILRNEMNETIIEGQAEIDNITKGQNEVHNCLIGIQEVIKKQTSPSMPTTVMPPDPRIFGRYEYVEQAVELLISATGAKIVILGAEGVGKTSVALKAVHDPRVVDRFGENRCWIPCEQATSSPLFVDLVAKSLSLPSSSSKDRLADIVTFLKNSKLLYLLFFDNFETPWGMKRRHWYADDVLRRLAKIPSVSFILTMRGNRYPSFYYMDWTEPRLQSLSQLDPDAAEEAFLNISPRFKGDSRLETLLQKLDGMPLAIKLMAKLLGGGGTITDLLEKWESESIKLLDQRGGDEKWESESASTLDQRDEYDRNIIQVSIKLSIDSFSVKGNMDAIPLLGVLAMLPAGAAVARIPDLCPSLPDWRAALSLLREAAVVYDSADGSRIQVLSPIQSYMTSHHPLGSRLLEDLRESYYALSPPEKNEAHHPAFVNVAKKLADDEVNMEAVLINALRDVNANREAAIKASVSYSRYLYYTRLRTEVIEEAVDVARKIDSPQLADCIGSSGTILTRTNQSDSAKQLLEEFVKLFVNQGYPKSLAKYLVSITNIWMKQGEHERAISMLEECRDIMLGRGEIDTAAGCLWLMGECHLRRLKYDLARSAFEQARSEFSSVGDDHHVAHCLMSLGAMLTYEGEYVEAQYVLGEALSIFMKLGLPFDVGECMSKLAVTHNRQRDYTLALAKLEEGLPIVMKTGLQSWIESYNADIGATQMMIELQVDDDDDEEEEEEEAEG